MELRELVAYAGEKYHIREQRKWAEFPGFSVLPDPNTGKWAALLMQQWDSESGTQVECCDIKCGAETLSQYSLPFLTQPTRMRGPKWIGITFDERTQPELVFKLFDKAIHYGERRGYTVVLSDIPSPAATVYRDTQLHFPNRPPLPKAEAVPEKLRQMRRMYVYGRESFEQKCRNFYRQAVFMEHYEDDAPWDGEFTCYYPTYQDLTIAQLRGYFSWRTRVRKGEFPHIASSLAYLYIYELLNGVGAASPTESLQKLKAFEIGFLDSGIGDERIRSNLHRWMLEFAVIHNLPAEITRQYAGAEWIQQDEALAVLRRPKEHSDEEVFQALCSFGKNNPSDSPVLTADAERGRHLFSEAWRTASVYRKQGKDLFTLCFGERKTLAWYPLNNALYLHREPPRELDYELNSCRRYLCRGIVWLTEAYNKLYFDRTLWQGFLHATELRLRRYLKTGRYLREKPEEAWAYPYIDAVIQADRRAVLEAAKPKITLDLSHLEQIRQDAITTRESLLTEEERLEETTADTSAVPDPAVEKELPTDVPLDAVQCRILRALINGDCAKTIIQENHLMPSLVADAINEALFDEIGDTVLSCEDDDLQIIEDYIEDITQMLGG